MAIVANVIISSAVVFSILEESTMILILKAWSSSAILVEKKIELILLILPKFSIFEGGGGKGLEGGRWCFARYFENFWP